MELTGGGRTTRSEIYPDKLCKAILTGLVKQMEADGRHGCSYRADEDVEMVPSDSYHNDPMEINQVSWEHM